MELALYCPVYGYYEAEKDTIGRRGDYYTSVSVGPLFGELLAFQMAEWLEGAEKKGGSGGPDSHRLRYQVVEAGAHSGRLARDILRWLRDLRPTLFQHLEYWIIEPSTRRREWQRETLAEFANKVHWMDSLTGFGSGAEPIPPRVIFANELLDAMPVHRFGWDSKSRSWFEWGVAVDGRQFVWTRLSAATVPAPAIPRLASRELSAVLPDGYIVESSPSAEAWWEEAAGILRSGRLLAIDYGLTDGEMFTPERCNGTLRAYHSHQSAADILAQPGQQDITAHVNFSSIQASGESMGLITETLVTQEQFLTPLAARIWEGHADFGDWGSERTRQLQTLIHPNHLGRSFRVLVQRRAGL